MDDAREMGTLRSAAIAFDLLTPGREDSDMSDRLRQILEAAVEVVGQYGFYGASLSQIADRVGVSKPGLLHYVVSKQNLLTMVLRHYYDETGAPAAFIGESAGAVLSGESKDLSLPRFYRMVAASNEERPALVRMFSVLNAESLDPDHPAHAYFERREGLLVTTMTSLPWVLPAGIDLDAILLATHSAMDGVQVRWLRDPSRGLTSMWAACEEALFPSPLWDGFR